MLADIAFLVSFIRLAGPQVATIIFSCCPALWSTSFTMLITLGRPDGTATPIWKGRGYFSGFGVSVCSEEILVDVIVPRNGKAETFSSLSTETPSRRTDRVVWRTRLTSGEALTAWSCHSNHEKAAVNGVNNTFHLEIYRSTHLVLWWPTQTQSLHLS